MYTNADTLTNKMAELKCRVDHLNPDIILITETKPKNCRYPVTQQEIDITGYEQHSTNLSNKIGRGTIIYTSNRLNARMVTTDTQYVESTWIKIKLRGEESLLVGCVYRSPQSTPANNKQLRNLIKEVSKDNPTHLLMVGDFNYSGIDWNSNTTIGEDTTTNEDYQFLETIRDSYLFQHVTENTRGRGTDTPHLLDLLLTNEEGMIGQVNHEAPLGKSDHCTLIFKFNCYTEQHSKTYQKFYYDRGDYDTMRSDMRIDWMERLDPNCEDPDKKWKIFKDLLDSAKTKNVPHKNVDPAAKKRRTGAPVDRHIIKASRKKNRTWTRYMETRDPAKHREFTKQRNKVKQMTRKLQREVEKKISRNAKANQKQFWSYIKKRLKTTSGIADLVKSKPGDEEQLTNSDGEKAEVLSTFFSSVYTEEPDTGIPVLERKQVDRPLDEIEFTREEVMKKLQKLKIDKSPGPDSVHPRLLREVAEEISPALACIFNSSLKSGSLPDDWKTAQVTAIYKKGAKKEPKNYRPVSLTCIVCKIMESIIRDHMLEHMQRNYILSDRQYGFVGGRSTALQLMKVFEEWTDILDSGGELDVIYMDFMKAFDSVPHKRLMGKLNSNRIEGTVQQWIKAFLVGRRQRVAVRGAYSMWADVLSGIPQGSVLGPILFVLYINDLPETVTSQLYMFADDTKIFNQIKTEDDQQILQEDLNRLQSWSSTWLLKFHPEKCKMMNVSRSKEATQRTYSMTSSDGTQHDLEMVSEEKDLGIKIDRNLTFDKHIGEKVTKANQVMGMIRRCFVHIDEENFKWLFKSIVRPHLEYANAIWNPIRMKDITLIENVQRRATKMVPQLKDMSYTNRLKHLKMPTLRYRRFRGDMIETFKIIRHIYDQRAIPTLSPENPDRRTRGHEFKLYKHRSQTRLRQHSFTERIVTPWNSLPNHVVQATSVKSFERRLDKHWADQEVIYDHEAPLRFVASRVNRTRVISDSSDAEDDLDIQVA